MVKIVLPEQRTPVMLDSAVLLALARLIRPRKYFEFGTYLGIETLNMAANLPEESHVYTLDLDDAAFQSLQQDVHDRPLSLEHFAHRDKLAFLNTVYERRITRLLGNSNLFDFSKFAGQIDMVYVDGGHDVRTMTSDTKNAFAMLSEDHATCVVWHDYGNRDYPQVKEYLWELSTTREIFHVEESMMAFSLANAADLESQLKAGKV
jgi:hypothetical protein